MSLAAALYFGVDRPSRGLVELEGCQLCSD